MSRRASGRPRGTETGRVALRGWVTRRPTMGAPFAFLKYVSQALLATFQVTSPLLTGLADLLPEVAKDVWRAWRKDTTDQERRQELEAVAQMAAGELAREVARLLREVAPDQPAPVRDLVAGYLTQVPGAVRRSLRRTSDPTGRTVPPALAPRRAEDLLAFLPDRLPRFRKGDRPLPGANWELEELLGVGGFGEVWKARNPDFADVPPVALKFCLDEKAAGQLVREARVVGKALRQHAHPGIVQLRNVHIDPVCLEYEYVAGGDLVGLVRGWAEDGGPSPEEATALLEELARTVAYAYERGVVHRDLKPANVLLASRPHPPNPPPRRGEGGDFLAPPLRGGEGAGGWGWLPKITDFGIGAVVARPAGETTRGARASTETGTSGYTFLYASPQQLAGEAADPRDDVYALGVIWYQLLTGNLNSGRPGGLRWQADLKERGVSA